MNLVVSLSISYLQQFLDSIKKTDKISKVIKFNQEVKTDLLAIAHHHLR